jgi:hypothetical protein
MGFANDNIYFIFSIFSFCWRRVEIHRSLKANERGGVKYLGVCVRVLKKHILWKKWVKNYIVGEEGSKIKKNKKHRSIFSYIKIRFYRISCTVSKNFHWWTSQSSHENNEKNEKRNKTKNSDLFVFELNSFLFYVDRVCDVLCVQY